MSPPLRIALGVILLASPVAAQLPDSAARLPDLLVVGRTPTGLGAFGGAVSVVEGAGVQRHRLAPGLDEALAFVPGVLAINRWNWSLDQRLVIRGFGARANFGVRGVKVLVDGVPQTLPDGQSQFTNLDLAQVDRIEVLRGAASSLHGNAAGGVVSFRTRSAPIGRGVHLATGTEFSTFGSRRIQGTVAGRGDRVSGTLGVSHFETDGFRQHSAATQRRVQGALDYILSPTTTALLRAAWADDPMAQNPGALTVAEAVVTPDAAAPNNLLRRADKAVTQGQIAFGLDHRGALWDAEVRTWVLGRELENPLAAPAPAPTTSTEGLWVGLDRRVVGARSAVTRRFVGGGRTTAGLDIQWARDDRQNRRHVAGTPSGDPFLDQREAVREAGLFLQVDLPLTRALALRTGIRHDATRFDVTDRLTATRADRTMASGNVHLGITWAQDATTAWASGATSFETPTTTELANRPDGTTGLNTSLGPQRSVAMEVGVRTRVGRLTLDAAVWHTTTRNAITPYQEVGGRSYFVNAGETRTRGTEVAARTSLGGAFVGLATWTFTDAVFTDYRLFLPGRVERYDGNRVAGLPRHHVRLGLRGVVRGVVLDIDHAFTSGQFADDANTIAVEGWGAGVTGARASTTLTMRRGPALTPFVAVQNVFGRHYVGSVTVNGGFGRVLEPSPGRVVSLGVRVEAPAR